MDTNLLVAALIPFLVTSFVCLLLWGIAGAAAWNARTPKDAQKVTGEVIGHSHYMSKGRTMWSPRYRVMLHDGRKYEGGAASSVSKSWKSPPVGAQVQLFYSAHDPESPLSETGFQRYMASIILFIVGGCVGAFGLVVAFRIATGH